VCTISFGVAVCTISLGKGNGTTINMYAMYGIQSVGSKVFFRVLPIHSPRTKPGAGVELIRNKDLVL
jgi:hypothetical protein